MQGVVAILIYFVSIVVFAVIFGEIRFRFFLKNKKTEVKEQKVNKYKNNENDTSKNSKETGFHRRELTPTSSCCNSDTYGIICVRCGRCGRKDL